MIKTNDFPNAENKVKKLSSIFNQYDFDDISKAVFCLGVCKNNRSVLESIMSLNWALSLHSHTGFKQIKTYSEFAEFYSEVKDILKPSIFDDAVVEDFGEVSLDVYGEKYSVIIGTGYSMVFPCLQLLPYLARYINKEDELIEVLSYNSYIIDYLKDVNTSDNEYGARFILPDETLFLRIGELFDNFDYEALKVIAAICDSDFIEKKHFIQCDNSVIPLANTSLLLDLYDKWYRTLGENQRNLFVNNALSSIALSLSKTEPKTGCNFLCPVSYLENMENPKLNDRFAFALIATKGVIIAVNADEYTDTELQNLINKCTKLKNDNTFYLNELISRTDDGNCKALSVGSDMAIEFIIYDSWANPEEDYITKTFRDEGYHICNALDVIYYLLFMDDTDELYDYLQYSKNRKDTQILCIGGDATTFLAWKEADHLIEKGAISYSLINLGFDSENEFVVDYYRNKLKSFPIGRGDYVLDNPFAWKIEAKDDGFYEYVQKCKVGFGGLFRAFDNGCYFFFPHNAMFYQNPKEYTEYKDVIGVVEEIIQRLMTQCNELISSSDSLNFASFQVMLMPETYARKLDSIDSLLSQDRKYIKSDSYIFNNKIIIRYIPLPSKIFEDLSVVSNRSVEVDVFLELMQPIKKYFPDFYQELSKYLDTIRSEQKEVSVSTYELTYSWKQEDEFYINVEPEYYLAVKKHIANVCLKAGIQPGIYQGKSATSVVRTIQKELIEDFENEIKQYNYLELYEKSLSYYATQIHEVMLHRKRYVSCNDVKESRRNQITKNIIKLREEAKHNVRVSSYIIETALFLCEKGSLTLSIERYKYLLAYANWLVVLSDNADMCYFTEDEAYVEVSGEYVIDVENKRDNDAKLGSELAKRMYDDPGYLVRDGDVDKAFFEKVEVAFEKDTEVSMKAFMALMYYLETGGQIDEEIFYRGNVLCFWKDELIEDFCRIQTVSQENIYKALELLCVNVRNLKNRDGKSDFYLPIGDKEKRCDRFEVNPIYEYEGMIIYSPSVIHNLREYWENSIFEFHLPYEIGMTNTKDILMEWKRSYEKKIVYDLKDVFESAGFIVRTNFELMNLNKAKYPQNLGDYDVFAVDTKKHEIWIVECKVIEKVETFYEMYRQQKRFFVENKYDEKFQRRIDYMNDNCNEVICDLNIESGKYTVKPFMCVNKVFASRYKDVNFPIRSYKEMVTEIEK